MAADGYCEGDREVEAEGKVAVEGVAQTDGLGVVLVAI